MLTLVSEGQIELPVQNQQLFVGKIMAGVEVGLQLLPLRFSLSRSDLFKVRTRVQTMLNLNWLKIGLSLAFASLTV